MGGAAGGKFEMMGRRRCLPPRSAPSPLALIVLVLQNIARSNFRRHMGAFPLARSRHAFVRLFLSPFPPQALSFRTPGRPRYALERPQQPPPSPSWNWASSQSEQATTTMAHRTTHDGFQFKMLAADRSLPSSSSPQQRFTPHVCAATPTRPWPALSRPAHFAGARPSALV